jgi:hypothetical protein
MEIKCILGNVVKRMQATPTEDGKWLLQFAYYKPLVDEVKSMEGAEWNAETKSWTVVASRRNTFAFAVLSGSERYRRFKRECADHKFPLASNAKKWSHQPIIYNAIMDRRRCIIAAVPRSGKTLPTMAAFMNSECKVCWWVTTKIAKLGVERELHKWYSDSAKRIVFMSYDAFTAALDQFKDNIKANPPQFVVFDECHKLKTPETQRTMAALLLSDITESVFKDLEYVIGLSGTPAPKDPCDWWTQCEVARSGYLREGSIKKFKSRYGKWKPYDPDMPVWESFLGWDKIELSALARRMSGLVYIFLQEDCLDLPPLRYEEINIQPSEEMIRVAKMITETGDNPLTTRIRLRQLSDGFQYDRVYTEETNTEQRSVEYLGSPKLERLKRDLEEYNDIGRICIYAGFHGSLDIIRQTCLSLGWDVLQIDGRGTFYHSTERQSDGTLCTTDKSTIFMALGEMDRSTDTHTIDRLAVVAHPLSGGAGNEFSSAPVSIYYSNPDSGEARMQSEERGHSGNMDMDRGHTIIDYILLPTDKLILDSLKEKKDLQSISMGALQRAIEEYNNVANNPHSADGTQELPCFL